MASWLLPSAWSMISSTLLLCLLFLFYKLVERVISTYHQRKSHTDIVSLPRHSLWGNLVNCGEKLNPSLDRHPDYGFEEIWEELDRPSCFLMDLGPVSTNSFLIVAEPGVMEQIVQPTKEYKHSFPKSDTLSALKPLIGKGSLIAAEGEEWKLLRKRFNKGFQPSHLHTLNPVVIEKIRVFLGKLEAASMTDKVFELKNYAQDLTTDVITEITLEKDFGAQTVPEGQGPKSTFGLLTAVRGLSSLVYKIGRGFTPSAFIDPIRPTKEFIYEKIYNSKLRQVLSQKLEADKRSENSSSRAVVQLALAGMMPTPALLDNTVSQIKTFLFAGQDTTSTVIQWMCYELWKAAHSPQHKETLRRLREEHDSVFGPGKYSALDVLQSSDSNSEAILNSKLPYTTAFVKEILRIHPPAATARRIPSTGPNAPPTSIVIDGKLTCVEGLRVYAAQWLIHRNPKVWGEDSKEFRPERFLDEAYMASLPPGSWRPFERGPRNCIGQELAMIESKMVLCAIARGFEFQKIGLTGRNGEKEIWNTHAVTSIPCDGMVMKVKMRD